MNPYTQLILVAVALLFIPFVAGTIYTRKLAIEKFLTNCDFMFNRAVINNDKIANSVKSSLFYYYQVNKPGFFRLLFSKKPLQPQYWYCQEQIDAFFLEQ